MRLNNKSSPHDGLSSLGELKPRAISFVDRNNTSEVPQGFKPAKSDTAVEDCKTQPQLFIPSRIITHTSIPRGHGICGCKTTVMPISQKPRAITPRQFARIGVSVIDNHSQNTVSTIMRWKRPTSHRPLFRDCHKREEDRNQLRGHARKTTGSPLRPHPGKACPSTT